MKKYSLEELTDLYIGPEGSNDRVSFEQELQIELLGQAIKVARQERKLTQEALGAMVGVNKSQISKIENASKDARLNTILKVFKALGAKLSFQVTLLNNPSGEK